jgi:hypothetical protein
MPLVAPPGFCYKRLGSRAGLTPTSRQPLTGKMSSHLLRMCGVLVSNPCSSWLTLLHSSMPEHIFDVHVLRTFKRDLIAVLNRLQESLPRPSEAINYVIYMLNQAFHDVELLYLVWRHERVQDTLKHGIYFFPPLPFRG